MHFPKGTCPQGHTAFFERMLNGWKQLLDVPGTFYQENAAGVEALSSTMSHNKKRYTLLVRT